MGLLPPLWGVVNVCSLALQRRNSISTPPGLHCSCWRPRQSFLLPDLAGGICSSLHGQPGGLSNPSPEPKVTQSSDAVSRAFFPPGVLSPALEPPAHRRCWKDHRTGTPLPWRQTGREGAGQPGERKALEAP